MQSFRSSALPGNVTGEPYPGNPNYSIQSTNYAFADINGDGIPDLLEATFLYESQRVPGYPLPQRVHFLDEGGGVVDTLVVLEDGEMHDNGDGDAGGGEEHDDTALSRGYVCLARLTVEMGLLQLQQSNGELGQIEGYAACWARITVQHRTEFACQLLVRQRTRLISR